MGGTSAILAIKDKPVIIITPTKGIIKGKEIKREAHHLFIYKDSADKWSDVEKLLKGNNNFILTITFDQIVEIKKHNPELYSKLVWINWFGDEFQAFAETADYRKAATEAFFQIFNDTKVPFILSTATPAVDYIDIPFHFKDELEYITIKHSEPKKLEIKLQPLNNYYSLIKHHNKLGRKVVVFSNDIRKYTNILGGELGNSTQPLVGDNLAIKTALIKFKSGLDKAMNDEGRIDLTKNILILSTSYLIGFDVEYDCVLLICVDQFSDTESKYLNDIIQAIGRCRKTPIETIICYKQNSFDSQPTKEDVIRAKKEIINTPFTVETLNQIHTPLALINSSLTFPKQNLITNLEDRNFIVKDEFEIYETLNNKKLLLEHRINQIYLQPIDVTADYLYRICTEIAGDDHNENGFDEKIMLPYAYGVIYNLTQSPYLAAIPNTLEKTITRIKTFLDVNDTQLIEDDGMVSIKNNKVNKRQLDMAIADGARIDSNRYNELHSITNQHSAPFQKAKQIIEALYTILGVKKDFLISDKGKIVMKGFEIVADVAIADFIKGLSKDITKNISKLIEDKNTDELNKIDLNELTTQLYFKHTHRTVNNILQKFLKKENLIMEEKEFGQILKKLDDVKTSLIKCKNGIYATVKSNDYSIKKQKENHRYLTLFHLSNSLNGAAYKFKITTKDDREFNIVTKTTRQLRHITSYKMITADISAAFATFTDELIGSNLKDNVYQNLMTSYTISRDEAKTKYNAILNSWQLPENQIIKVLKNAGYSPKNIEDLLPIIKSGKGSFYKSMTVLEKAAIKLFVTTNNITNYTRIHDAVTFLVIPNKKYITDFGNVKFEIK